MASLLRGAASLRPPGARRDRVPAAVADPPLRGFGRGGRLPRPRPRRLAARGCAGRRSCNLQRLPRDHRVRPGPAERDDRRRATRRARAARRPGREENVSAALRLRVPRSRLRLRQPGAPPARSCLARRLRAFRMGGSGPRRARTCGALPRPRSSARTPLQPLVDRPGGPDADGARVLRSVLGARCRRVVVDARAQHHPEHPRADLFLGLGHSGVLPRSPRASSGRRSALLQYTLVAGAALGLGALEGKAAASRALPCGCGPGRDPRFEGPSPTTRRPEPVAVRPRSGLLAAA